MSVVRRATVVFLGLAMAGLLAACAPDRATPPLARQSLTAPVVTAITPAAAQTTPRRATAQPSSTPLMAGTVAPPTSTLAATARPNQRIPAGGTADSMPQVRPLLEAINVRRGPGISFDVIATLRRDQTAAVLGRNRLGDWYAVRTEAGLSGWVASNVVELVAGAAADIAVAATIPAPPTAPPTAAPATAAASATAPPSAGQPPPPRPSRTPTPNVAPTAPPAPEPSATPAATGYVPPPTHTPLPTDAATPTVNPYP